MVRDRRPSQVSRRDRGGDRPARASSLKPDGRQIPLGHTHAIVCSCGNEARVDSVLLLNWPNIERRNAYPRPGSLLIPGRQIDPIPQHAKSRAFVQVLVTVGGRFAKLVAAPCL